jgi:hypothetical protein
VEGLGISVTAGVIAGLLTSAIIFLAAYVWRDRFLPWIEDKTYQGIRVDGNWSLVDKYDDDGKALFSQRETLELEQKAARLSGRLILVPKEGVKLKTRTLKANGVVRDRFVIISCVPATRRNLGYQAFLGEISGDGAELRGQACFYDIEKASLQCVEVVYARKEGVSG